MAKARYKIGSMIQAQREEEEAKTGIIKTIVTTEQGYHYSFEDADNLGDLFAEEQIISAFRPIIARQKRDAKPRSKSAKRSSKKEESAHAQ